MSNHLRHCPKHRKPLPCAHCALVSKPPEPDETPEVLPVVSSPTQLRDEPALTCEYHHVREVWVCLYCGHNASENDITAEGIPALRVCPTQNIQRANRKVIGKELDKKHAERERRAAAARARRKEKSDQRAAIKKALKTPVADILAAAAIKAEAQKLPSMNQGKYMTDAPTGKGALVYKPPKKIDQICAVISRSEALGSPTIDHETGESFFASNDRRHTAPDGAGASSDEKPEITGLSTKGFTSDVEEQKKFQVNLDGPEYRTGLAAAITEFTFREESKTFCRLCQQIIEERIEVHFTEIHGDPAEPRHDIRFGDVIQKHVKRIKRAHAKLEKAGRDAALEITADKKASAEIGAIKDGYVKLNGKWIPKVTA